MPRASAEKWETQISGARATWRAEWDHPWAAGRRVAEPPGGGAAAAVATRRTHGLRQGTDTGCRQGHLRSRHLPLLLEHGMEQPESIPLSHRQNSPIERLESGAGGTRRGECDIHVAVARMVRLRIAPNAEHAPEGLQQREEFLIRDLRHVRDVEVIGRSNIGVPRRADKTPLSSLACAQQQPLGLALGLIQRHLLLPFPATRPTTTL